MLTKNYQWRSGAALGLALGLALASRGVFAAEVQVRVACVGWSTEQVSQVEARIRAALLLEDLGARQVLIACEGSEVEVEVESSSGRLSRPVTRGAESLEDSIVQEVDLALRALQAQPAAATPAPSVAPSVEPPPVPPPPVVAPQPSPRPAAAPVAGVPAPPATLELSVGALGARWAAHSAWGAGVGASLGGERLRFGLELGGFAALGEPPGFDVNEWHVGLRSSWSPAWLWGVRGNLGLAGSLFLTAPQGLSVDTATSLSAGVVDVALSRPFWFGAFGLSPELGLSIATAERRVTIDEIRQLTLPVLVPVAKLSLVWRQR